MNQDEFAKAYFKRLAAKLATHGYEPQALVKNMYKGIDAMVENDGSRTNEQAFWQVFTGVYGEKAVQDMPVFDDYYRNEFQTIASLCGCNPAAAQCVRVLKEAGYRVALATNPVFPAFATESRIRWAGMEAEMFELYTTYESMRYCKPNLKYYEEICRMLGVKAEECLMVGNDVEDDMVAKGLGMKVFLLTDCLLNRNDRDISVYPSGGFEQMMDYIREECSQ